jgi:multidrug efflux system membrane fusion protein
MNHLPPRLWAAVAAFSALVLLGPAPGAPPFRAAAQGAPPAPPPVTVARPIVKQIQEVDDFIGRFEAVDQVDVRARVSGYLDKVHFVDGAIVREGDPLFTIDQRPYQAALQEAQATLNAAKAQLDFTSRDLQRGTELLGSGTLSEQLVEQRREAFLRAQGESDRAEATVAQAKLNVEFTDIRAPISGRVSRRLVSRGNLVKADDTVLTNIVTLDPINFYFDVDEPNYLAYSRMAASSIRPSDGKKPAKVRITLSLEREATREGHIDFVDNRLDAASGTMRARAVIGNKDFFLTPGMFGRATLLGSDPYRGVLVPDEALASDQDRRVVYVVGADNVVSLKPVRPGPRIDGYRVIREGLDGSETIVVNGLMRVRPGMTIEPQLTQLPPTRENAGG